MTLPTTTRRALLGSAPVAALAIAVPTTAAIGEPRAQWDAAMRRYLTAKSEAEAFGVTYDRIHAASTASLPTTDSIHWQAFPYSNHDDVARRMDLDKRWTTFLQEEGRTWFSPKPEETKARFRAALDSVKAYRDAVARHNRDSGMDAANERYEALGDELHAADTALMNTPAPDLAALRWKLERFPDDDGDLDSWTAKFVGQTFADLARLIPNAG